MPTVEKSEEYRKENVRIKLCKLKKTEETFTVILGKS